MYMIAEVSQYVAVASFTEAWIEIISVCTCAGSNKSPPSRRRGLKLSQEQKEAAADAGRLLHGGVD